MGVYEDLGVRRVINAWGPMTKVGGSRMLPDVLEAMTEAGKSFVDLDELQQKAGARIAQLIGVEGCYIACGCGADVVVFSGGKGLRGPQSTGLVLARPEIVAACALNGPPNHSIGRPMKVGKEEMVGLVRAVELYLAQDHDAVYEQWRSQLAAIEKALADTPGVTAERTEASWSEGIPATKVTIDANASGTSAENVGAALA